MRSGRSSKSGPSLASDPSPPPRAQVEPLAALVAVFAVGIALTTYAGLVDATLPTHDRNLAEPTVERAERAVADHGVVAPSALSEGLRAGPDGYRVNLSLDLVTTGGDLTADGADFEDRLAEDDSTAAGNDSMADRGDFAADGTGWYTGPTPPRTASTDVAEIGVSVRVAPGRIRHGRLRAVVWR